MEPACAGIDRLLQEARRELDRVPPERLEEEVRAGAVVIDTRPAEQRRRDGKLPHAVTIDRNVLEWRLDPTSSHRLRTIEVGTETRVIVVCNEGYSSSLAAATLRRIGLRRATDLIDGYQGWLALQGLGRDARDAPEGLAPRREPRQ